ncbi:MAG TPA: diguanylate cyclase [Spirochaetota bacterium]|mgnify:CR=1 FL=1|jgi:diguanylate cyclase (GGDEF)-like protein|nr:diguanylate cyclase [Spirochaetota bacterium]OQA99631.1 MAG: Response regulator PleD [Spirochaetes bacterium ADurb.Bin218]HOK02109.1 diguanylate cyclase [Spirochaetota bacterium]HOK91756.1 diguanylate cyclase [Spirochaetota bacterium]HOQ12397.1 diguanylate cyclase [Spirochaetota bacterium]
MKALLVNQTRTLTKAIEELGLSSGFDLISSNIDSIEESIKEHSPEVIILNWSEGLNPAVCSDIKKIKIKSGYIYLIVIGTKDSMKGLLEGVRSGADDFLLIPFSREEVLAKITVARRVIELNRSFIKTKKKLLKFAKEDPVTSLLNRRALIDEIQSEMGRASRQNEFASAIMINLINYDEIQRDFGLKVFDAFLAELASRLKKSIRPYDKIGRFEFSRFLIYLPHARSEDAKKVAERIIKKIQEKKFKYKDKYIEPCLTIGISELDPSDMVKGGDAETQLINELILESFIRRSEFATTSACEKGSNAIEIYTF